MIKKFAVEYETPRGSQELSFVYAFDIIAAKQAFIYGHPGFNVIKVKCVIDVSN